MSHNSPRSPLSLAYYTVPELSPPEMIRAASVAGCQYIGLRLLGSQPADPMPIMTDADLRRLTKQTLADTGVRVLDANTVRLIPQTRIADYEPFLDIAAELGAKHVLATVDDTDSVRRQHHLQDLCERAASRRLTIEIEFVPWLAIRNVRDANDFITHISGDLAGIAVDALHFARSGSKLDDLARVAPGRLRYAHLCDAPSSAPQSRDELFDEAVNERLFPGEGELDLIGLVRALPRGIPFALEIPTTRLARAMPASQRIHRAVDSARRVIAAAWADQ